MRRTLASPILAISSNNPSAIFADALSASISTARRGERSSEAMIFPKSLHRTAPSIQAAPTDGDAIDIPMSGRLPPDLICSSPAKQQMPRSPHALADGAREIVPLFRLKRCEQGVGQDFRYALSAVDLLQKEGFRSRYRGDNGPLRRRARQDQRVDVTGKFNARPNMRDIRQIIICIETRKEACALG